MDLDVFFEDQLNTGRIQQPPQHFQHFTEPRERVSSSPDSALRASIVNMHQNFLASAQKKNRENKTYAKIVSSMKQKNSLGSTLKDSSPGGVSAFKSGTASPRRYK